MNSVRYEVNRPLFQEENFNILYPTVPKLNYSDVLRQKFSTFRRELVRTSNCKKRSLNLISHLFPCIAWLSVYNCRQYLLKDIIAGFTVAFMHIPQGMAYVALVPLPPVYGLYTSFFPVLIYTFFGTSRYISLGTYAVVSIMLGSAISRYDQENPNALGPSPDTDTVNQEHLDIALSITALVGLIELGLGLMHVGFVTTYMSTPVVRGFTTGASIHVFTSQLNSLFGLPLPRRDGIGKVIRIYVDFFRMCRISNVPTLSLSLVCIAILVSVKALTSRFKQYIKFPVPIEFILIIVGAGTSYLLDLNKYGIGIVGNIPEGMPPIRLPATKYWLSNVGQAFAIAIVAFFTSFSMAKILGEKHEDDVNPNKELIAYGLSTTIGSFFGAVVSSASLSRSLVQEGVGGQTQLAGLVSCFLLLGVILKIGSLFKPLPSCVLSAIIVVALRGMFYQLADVKTLYRQNKTDLSIFLVTLLSTALLDVDIGLAVGIVFALMTLIVRTQRPTICLLGRLADTDIYVDLDKYKHARPLPGIKIYSFQCFIYYANAGKFRDNLYAICHIPQRGNDGHTTNPHTPTEVSPDSSNIHALRVDSTSRNNFYTKSSTKWGNVGRTKNRYDLKNHDMRVLDGSHSSFTSLNRGAISNGPGPTLLSMLPDERPYLNTSFVDTDKEDEQPNHHDDDDQKRLVTSLASRIGEMNQTKLSQNFHTSSITLCNVPAGLGSVEKLETSGGCGKPPKNVSNSSLVINTPPTPKEGWVGDGGGELLNDKVDKSIPFDRTEAIILDFNYVTYIDTVAMDILVQIVKDMESRPIFIALARCNANALNCMEKANFFEVFERRQIYLTIHDAVLALTRYREI